MFIILAFPFCLLLFFRRNFLNGFFLSSSLCVMYILYDSFEPFVLPKQNYSFPFFTFFSRYVYHFCQFVFANPTSLKVSSNEGNHKQKLCVPTENRVHYYVPRYSTLTYLSLALLLLQIHFSFFLLLGLLLLPVPFLRKNFSVRRRLLKKIQNAILCRFLLCESVILQRPNELFHTWVIQ